MTRLLADLRMPGVELFDGVDGLADRIRLLVHEMSTFFRRSQSWYYVREREPGVQTWADAEARFAAELDTLVRAALGPLKDDADAVAVVSAVLGTWVLGTPRVDGSECRGGRGPRGGSPDGLAGDASYQGRNDLPRPKRRR